MAREVITTKKMGRPSLKGDHALRVLVENYVTQNFGEVCHYSSDYTSLKINGGVFASFNCNTAKFRLRVRAHAIYDLGRPRGVKIRMADHTFSARITCVDTAKSTLTYLFQVLDNAMEHEVELQRKTVLKRAKRWSAATKQEYLSSSEAKFLGITDFE